LSACNPSNEVVTKSGAGRTRNALPPKERWIANDRVKTNILAKENLRIGKRPVQRPPRGLSSRQVRIEKRLRGFAESITASARHQRGSDAIAKRMQPSVERARVSGAREHCA
jgi:hypothetical protein